MLIGHELFEVFAVNFGVVRRTPEVGWFSRWCCFWPLDITFFVCRVCDI